MFLHHPVITCHTMYVLVCSSAACLPSQNVSPRSGMDHPSQKMQSPAHPSLRPRALAILMGGMPLSKAPRELRVVSAVLEGFWDTSTARMPSRTI
jgi:hypothetical protein